MQVVVVVVVEDVVVVVVDKTISAVEFKQLSKETTLIVVVAKSGTKLDAYT
jgi:glucose-6-phosphate isomerase